MAINIIIILNPQASSQAEIILISRGFLQYLEDTTIKSKQNLHDS